MKSLFFSITSVKLLIRLPNSSFNPACPIISAVLASASSKFENATDRLFAFCSNAPPNVSSKPSVSALRII